MGRLLRLVLLLFLVVGVVWALQNVDFRRLRVSAGELRGAAAKVDAKVPDLKVPDLDASKIAEELKQTGRVVRRRAVKAAEQVAEATKDARTTAAIKTKLALDPSLSALEVSVDTTDGRVTLAGRADSPADIARAIEIAFEQDDVYEVISTLQVRDSRKSSQERGRSGMSSRT
jgi:osmotically-inducible protein OsmY